jgi:hypothetical protein
MLVRCQIGLSIVHCILGEEMGMDEALMPEPAGPPIAQPRANATRFFNAVAGKGMRMAKAIASGNTGFDFFKRMSVEQKADYDAMQKVEYAKKDSRQARKSRNSWQGQRDRVVLSLIHAN